MKLELATHNARGVDIVLDQPPSGQEQCDDKQVVVAGQERDTHNYQCCDQGTSEGNEFHGTAHEAEDDCVGYAQQQKDDGVNHQRQSGQDKLGANISSEH